MQLGMQVRLVNLTWIVPAQMLLSLGLFGIVVASWPEPFVPAPAGIDAGSESISSAWTQGCAADSDFVLRQPRTRQQKWM